MTSLLGEGSGGTWDCRIKPLCHTRPAGLSKFSVTHGLKVIKAVDLPPFVRLELLGTGAYKGQDEIRDGIRQPP